MDHPCPPVLDQRTTDQQHLQLLTVFHFVLAGLLFAGIGFLALHFTIMNLVFTNPETWRNMPKPPPREVFMIFKLFYAFAGICLVLAFVGNLLSGLCLRARKNRMFSLVVAGLNCVQVPVGTALGVCTIVVLIRESVRELYEAGPTR